MAVLGADEERQLFAADAVKAIMNWPPGYSVDVADWVTETKEAFARPVVHFSGEYISVPSAAREAQQGCYSGRELQRTAWAPAAARWGPGSPGLFTEALVRSTDPTCASGRDVVPGHCTQAAGGQSLSQQQQQLRQWQQQQQQQFRALPSNREELSATAATTATWRRRQPRPKRATAEPGAEQDCRSNSPASRRGHSTEASAGCGPRRPGKSNWGGIPVTGPGPRPALRLRRSQSQLCENGWTGQVEAEGAALGERSSGQQAGGASAGQAPSAAVVTSCQQLLQRQKVVLQQQYKQMSQLNQQLQELEQALSALQMQGSADNPQRHAPRQPPLQQQQQQQQQAVAQCQSGSELALSDLQPFEYEAEDGSICWSLDPRDYRRMPADALSWIPPAGIPSRYSGR
ncbi:hypothetical protein, conserved [Eimeria tenella]|uniref:Uncharacterized protein n=1 Tax=Eimeria tenella TaxID=5802 RepID=U6KPY7_EIMTE|nr:hypothetical protein, conserved [Eimeria tenella]CDJ38327.1 hypothetical protein, conserved [Eimeria tenella]|eukprot:XP_013229165.1 hypothetical protein, conserved [Eimeria tenella]